MAKFKSLRDYVKFLKKRGELLEYDEPVDVRYELSALTKRYDGEKTILFKNVRGYNIPVLT
ncbi:MAG TPA: menaquinone biosynthesis decarboxylase, partial [Candidatus Bathyarchaeota archaeon]|nr:menaquinone biosynthesis decarboxylase [Candidatus Bathyarchaeota archaeon]